MQKSSFKLYIATLLFTLTLASISFAGDVHCPAPPPPPPNGGGDGGRLVAVVTNDVFNENLKYIKDFLGSLFKF